MGSVNFSTDRSLLARVLAGLVFLTLAMPAVAERNHVSIAKQFGDSYLPLIVMENRRLLEKHADRLGVPNVKVDWKTVSGGATANDALLSGDLDFVSGGVGPMLQMWSATKGKVKAVAALNRMPLLLNTNNPSVKSILDFTDKDRIAVPAVKVSMQAVVLRMAAEKSYGAGQADRLDRLTVTMTQADATAALMTGSTGITAHFGNSPFQFQQLKTSGVRTVLNSYDVLGGPATFGVVWATDKFRTENPRIYSAFLSALEEATKIINEDKRKAAELYVDATRSKLSVDVINEIISDPQVSYSVIPSNTLGLAKFMHKSGQINSSPNSWKDYFFPELHARDGS